MTNAEKAVLKKIEKYWVAGPDAVLLIKKIAEEKAIPEFDVVWAMIHFSMCWDDEFSDYLESFCEARKEQC
jgi:hypothetical protein